MSYYLCEECFKNDGPFEYEALSIAPGLRPCQLCGRYDSRHKAGLRVNAFRSDPRPPTKQATMEGVREHGESGPVSIGLCNLPAHSARLVIKASCEGGHADTQVDLLDLIQWLHTNRPDLLYRHQEQPWPTLKVKDLPPLTDGWRSNPAYVAANLAAAAGDPLPPEDVAKAAVFCSDPVALEEWIGATGRATAADMAKPQPGFLTGTGDETMNITPMPWRYAPARPLLITLDGNEPTGADLEMLLDAAARIQWHVGTYNFGPILCRITSREGKAALYTVTGFGDRMAFKVRP